MGGVCFHFVMCKKSRRGGEERKGKGGNIIQTESLKKAPDLKGERGRKRKIRKRED